MAEQHSAEKVQRTVYGLVHEAAEHYTNYLEYDQIEATNLYYGEQVDTRHGDLSKIPGRSGAVSTDVRDAIFNILPSLMRILLGSDRVVEFLPIGLDDVDLARQQTSIVDFVIRKDSDGFRVISSAVIDALVRRIGWVKWMWDSGEGEHRGVEYVGLDEMQAAAVAADEAVLGFEITSSYTDEQTGQPLYDAAVIRKGMGRVRIMEVPPEEVFYTRGARSLNEADCVAHVRELPASDVVAMGYDVETVNKYKGEQTRDSSGSLDGDGLRTVRHRFDGDDVESPISQEVDESRQKVIFTEAYCRVDVDGDGIAELRMFHCIGNEYKVLNGEGLGELVDEVPFARFTPLIEPHLLVGLSVADVVGDVQVKKSLIERALEHSLARAIDPPFVYNEHAVNASDIASPNLHKAIRVRGDVDKTIREIPTSYLGDQAIGVLTYMNEKRADRIGMTRASEGLDPSALQSSTAEAVAGTFSRSAEIKELIARNIAESGMKDLFKGVLRTIQRNQDFVRNLRLDSGEFVTMDPSTWDIERDVEINIGETSTERKMAGLTAIAQSQMGMMEAGSPLVSWVEVGNTHRKMAEALGYRVPTEFFRRWTPQEQEQHEQMLQAQAQPTPEEKLVEVEQGKVILQDLRERDKMVHEAALKELELEWKYETDIDRERLKGRYALIKEGMTDATLIETAKISAKSKAQGGSSGTG